MAVRPILRWPDERLATVCDPVASGEDATDLIADLFETMYDAPGRGLAAPQIGVMRRVFVIDVSWKTGARTPMAFVNPRLQDVAESCSPGEEGCLSIPGITVSVSRPDWVVVSWSNGDGGRHTRRFDGIEARCIQHEMDHLDGVLTLQRLDGESRALADAAYAEGLS